MEKKRLTNYAQNGNYWPELFCMKTSNTLFACPQVVLRRNTTVKNKVIIVLSIYDLDITVPLAQFV
jgi:hypothetical protein